MALLDFRGRIEAKKVAFIERERIKKCVKNDQQNRPYLHSFPAVQAVQD